MNIQIMLIFILECFTKYLKVYYKSSGLNKLIGLVARLTVTVF